MEDKILTLHPEGKQGVNIKKAQYDIVRQAILGALGHGEVAFTDLLDCVSDTLSSTFEGSVAWYVTTIKLDLEARGEIERVPNSNPQRLRLPVD